LKKLWGSYGEVMTALTRTRTDTHTYEFGLFRLDARERLLMWCGEYVPLAPKILDTLLALVARHGHILEKEELMQMVWPDTFVEEVNLAKNICALRRMLVERDRVREYIETIPRRGYRFIAPVREAGNRASEGDSVSESPVVEPLGGVVPLDSIYYVTRAADLELHAAIERRDGIVLIEGTRQSGKTSLLARGLQQARLAGLRVVLTDLQMCTAADLETVETFLLSLGELLADRLCLDVPPRAIWDPLRSPTLNFERYLRRQVFRPGAEPLIWAVDEADRLFTRPFVGEVFALFRTWQNARSLEPQGPWRQLTLLMAYATEAQPSIIDLSQSPFNVGTRLRLEDFTLDQITELNRRAGSPLQSADELRSFARLIGGHPYEVRRGLSELAHHGLSVTALEQQAASEAEPVCYQLRQVLAALSPDRTPGP